MRFVVIGRDGTDLDAPERRQAARPGHLEGIEAFVRAGNVLVGGALLDDEGTMRGSVLLVDFPSREALNDRLEHDPYVTGDVWREVEVRPFRVAVGSWLLASG
jgi:uncharacterized protein YciI